MKSFKKILSVILAMIILLSVMPVISFSAATTLQLNSAVEVWIDGVNEIEYTFKPSSSGYYRIMSWGDDDPYVYCLNSAGDFVADCDDCGYNSYNFNCVAYLTKGKTYTYYVGAFSETTNTTIYFEKLDVKNATAITEGKDYDVVFTDVDSKPALFKFVPKTDGYYGFYSVDGGDPIGYLYDSEMNLISSADDGSLSYDFYLDWYLHAGETYYYEAATYYRGDYDSYSVAIEKTVVIEELSIIKYPDDITVNEAFIGDTISLDGLELLFKYSDGSTQEWRYDDDPVPENSNLRFDWYYDEENKPYVEIATTFAYDYYYLQVVENNISSISIESAPEFVLYEGYDSYYDEYTGIHEYDYFIPYNVNVSINYTDGTSEVMPYFEGDFDCYDTQCYEPWEIGEHYVYITYLGYEAALPVQVKANPVESVTLNSAPTAVYAFADPFYGSLEDNGEYWLFPYNLDGISFTVKYTDGTEKTYDNSDIDYETFTVDGFEFNLEPIVAYEVGVYPTAFGVLGKSVSYDVTIIPEVMLGDVDYDKVVSVMDSTELQRYSAKLQTLTDEQLYIGDVDRDAVISVMDATRIQMYVAKLISEEEFLYNYTI